MSNRRCMRPGLLVLAVMGVLAALSFGQAQTKIRTVPVSGEKSHEVDGPTLYKDFCAVCHGMNGHGGGPAAAALKKAPADLTKLSQNAGGKFPTVRVKRFIQGADIVDAHGARDMPMWGEVFQKLNSTNPSLVDLRVTNLARHIETLQGK
jgi:mono/diheme cytochrome c family protein